MSAVMNFLIPFLDSFLCRKNGRAWPSKIAPLWGHRMNDIRPHLQNKMFTCYKYRNDSLLKKFKFINLPMSTY